MLKSPMSQRARGSTPLPKGPPPFLPATCYGMKMQLFIPYALVQQGLHKLQRVVSHKKETSLMPQTVLDHGSSRRACGQIALQMGAPEPEC